MIDWYSAIYALQVIITLMAAIIATIAFLDYIRVRSWKLLALSVAFSLLTLKNMMLLMRGDTSSYIFLSALALLGFVILACVYYFERKARGVRITKLRWIAGSLISICYFSIVAYFVLIENRYYELFPQALLPDFILYLLTSSTVLILIYSIISLYSYYRVVRNKKTVVTMTGFVCLLSTHLLSLLLIIPPSVRLLVSNVDYFTQLQFILTLLTFTGFALFLAAMVYPKDSR